MFSFEIQMKFRSETQFHFQFIEFFRTTTKQNPISDYKFLITIHWKNNQSNKEVKRIRLAHAETRKCDFFPC